MGRRCAQDALTEKLIYPLQHAYTPAELSFGALKGADAAAAAVLKGAAAHSGCELHLALISIEESGIAEHTGYYGSRWGRSSDDEEEFEAVEVCDRSAMLSHWLRADGAPTPLKDIPFDESEVCPPGSLDDMEPDEEHFHEATGNEGASFNGHTGGPRWPFGLKRESWPSSIRPGWMSPCPISRTSPLDGKQEGRRVVTSKGARPMSFAAIC